MHTHPDLSHHEMAAETTKCWALNCIDRNLQLDWAVSCDSMAFLFAWLQGNVPIGDVDTPRVIVSDLPSCHCKADSEAPCGPDSDCINRCMFYECHPAVCPAGERCLNRRFQLRQYPAVKPFRTDRRGWGLITCVNIDKVHRISCRIVLYRVQLKMTLYLKFDYLVIPGKFLRQILQACLMCFFVWNYFPYWKLVKNQTFKFEFCNCTSLFVMWCYIVNNYCKIYFKIRSWGP